MLSGAATVLAMLAVTNDPHVQMLAANYSEDPARVAKFAESLKRSSLTGAEIAEAEHLIHYGTVPLLLQKNFAEKLLAHDGGYDTVFHRLDLSVEAVLRDLSVIDTVSARITREYKKRWRDPDLLLYWERVWLYERAHQYWDFGGNECNGTVIAEGGRIYQLTAHHCVEHAADRMNWAVDAQRDLAVQHIAQDEYHKWKVRRVGEAQTSENRHFIATSELPRLALGFSPEQMRGRLVFSNGHGRDYSYYRNVVRKVHFSFVIDLPLINGPGGDYYSMILPLAESAQWIHPGLKVGAQGSSGTAIVDAATGQIIGVLSSVLRVPPQGCEHICTFLGIWSNAQHVVPLLRESRSKSGVQ